MALDDFAEPEVAATAIVAAAIFSPRVHKLLRKGTVYGLAGALIVGDTVSSFGKSVVHGFQKGRSSATNTPQGNGQATMTHQQASTEPAARPMDESKPSNESTPG